MTIDWDFGDETLGRSALSTTRRLATSCNPNNAPGPEARSSTPAQAAPLPLPMSWPQRARCSPPWPPFSLTVLTTKRQP